MTSHVTKFLVHHIEKHTPARFGNRPGPPAYSEDDEEVPWPELLGSNDWKGLLQPLNLGLRKLVLRCGDFCQATYDAFNNDKNSKYCGSSRYGKTSFFQKVMMENGSDYEVACFLYGTARVSHKEAIMFHSHSREAWDRESNWIGYVAVTTDEASVRMGRREIYVAWRGTTRNYEWINVMGAKLQSIQPLLRPEDEQHQSRFRHLDDEEDDDDEDEHGKLPKVMRGWVTIYVTRDPKSPFTRMSAREQLSAKIRELRERYRGEDLSITLCGHSLGASLSVLAGFDLVENGVRDIPVAAFVFGCPQVGNKAFMERCRRYPNLKFLHVRNTIDLIPHYPSKLLGYDDIEEELVIDTRKSPYLKESKNPSDWHNLQAMLHVVAGWTGEKGEFDLKVRRSIALVNKSCEFLKEECLVPGSWWVEKNKGMVLDDNGEWIIASLAEEDLPVPEF
ncbi:hypothetical protein MLD38_030580 [Melastoma candidum]|uniref:Uncharacterized protein n=1 Tax=Melastoma candidum TaxID=119954 RepID=A0ACB9MS98_9MYRT|nr:hypothetical protein MLD38_030580 [Melastoma candidum]